MDDPEYECLDCGSLFYTEFSVNEHAAVFRHEVAYYGYDSGHWDTLDGWWNESYNDTEWDDDYPENGGYEDEEE